MRENILGFLFLLLIGFGCRKEAPLTEMDSTEPNYFAPLDSAMDEESVLRREFNQTEQIHVLFNDTIQRIYLGKDAFGDSSWRFEKVDLSYSLTSIGDDYGYVFLPNIAAKKSAVNFLKQKLLPKLGIAVRPYSLLLVDTIKLYDDYRNRYQYFTEKVGWRCTALALNGVVNMSDSAQNVFCNTVYTDIATNLIQKQSNAFLADFTSISEQYYSKDKDEDLGWPYVIDNDKVRKVGFLTDKGRYYLPSKNDDLAAYITAIFSETDVSFQNKYGNYPLVISKFNILKDKLITLGFKL